MSETAGGMGVAAILAVWGFVMFASAQAAGRYAHAVNRWYWEGLATLVRYAPFQRYADWNIRMSSAWAVASSRLIGVLAFVAALWVLIRA